MSAKPKNNAGTGALKKAAGVIIQRLNKDLTSKGARQGKLNPLLMPEKIKVPKGNAVNLNLNDPLDMKSKKIIENIDQSLNSLSSVNPIDEGGFGYDHPAVKTKSLKKKRLSVYSQAEATENIDEYAAILQDLKTIMGKLGAAREQIFTDSSKKTNP